MIPLPAALFIMALAAVVTFAIGWNASVYAWRARNLELAEQFHSLSHKWKTLAEAMEKDPVRMGLNTGQEFILRELETFCERHRERLEEQAK